MNFDFGPEQARRPLDESLRELEERIAVLAASRSVKWGFEDNDWVGGTRHLAINGLGGPEAYSFTQSLGPNPTEGQVAYSVCTPHDAMRWPAGATMPEEVEVSSMIPAPLAPADLAADLIDKMKGETTPYDPAKQQVVYFSEDVGGMVVSRSKLVDHKQTRAINRNLDRNGGLYLPNS